MQITNHTVQVEEFTLWAERVKSAFHGKTLYITLSDEPLNSLENGTPETEITDFADRDGLDETEYLMRSPENKRRLLQAIENVKNGENLIRIENLDDLSNPEKIRQILQHHHDSTIDSRKKGE